MYLFEPLLWCAKVPGNDHQQEAAERATRMLVSAITGGDNEQP